jgi:hypothetical protein
MPILKGQTMVMSSSDIYKKMNHYKYVPPKQSTKNSIFKFLNIHGSVRAHTHTHTHTHTTMHTKRIFGQTCEFCINDNVPSHTAVSLNPSFTVKQIPALEQSMYSPDFALCFSIMFAKLKISLRRSHFKSLEEIQRNMTRELKGLPENDF